MDNSVVTLNVGGSVYTTCKDTLTQIIGEDHSHLLRLMFTQENIPLQRDHNGNVFLDRDGATFAYILDYLRNNGKLNLCAFPIGNIGKMHKLIVEAEFFQLKQLVQFYRMSKLPTFDAETASKTVEVAEDHMRAHGRGLVRRKQSIILSPSILNADLSRLVNTVSLQFNSYSRPMSNFFNANVKVGAIKEGCDQLVFCSQFRVASPLRGWGKVVLHYSPESRKLYYLSNSDKWEIIDRKNIDPLDPFDEWYFAYENENNDILVSIENIPPVELPK